MARIVTQTIEIKLSQLVKDADISMKSAISPDLIPNLETVVQQLVDTGIIVEVNEINN